MVMIEVKVFDIGDYSDVLVIEVLVVVGDMVKKDQGLVILELDKVILEVLFLVVGVVKEIKVKLGDILFEGVVVVVLDVEGVVDVLVKVVVLVLVVVVLVSKLLVIFLYCVLVELVVLKLVLFSGKLVDIECEMVVLGFGLGGYIVVFCVVDVGLDMVLVECYVSFGGVCFNVGCILFKVLLYVVVVIDEVVYVGDFGVEFGKLIIILDKLCQYKEKVVNQLIKGLVGMVKQCKVCNVQGVGRFIFVNELEIIVVDGSIQLLCFQKCIIVVGLQVVKLLNFLWDDKCVMDFIDVLELVEVLGLLLVVGGGIIGLEMVIVYSVLGSKVIVVEFMDQLMLGVDKDLVKLLVDCLKKQGIDVYLKIKVFGVIVDVKGIIVIFEVVEEGQLLVLV